jgi:nickel/cobalt exporter
LPGAPYASGALIVLVGLYTGWLGWEGIQQGRPVQATQVKDSFASR